MGVLIDTSVLIEYERGRLDLAYRFEGRADEPFFLSVISVSELLHGVRRAHDAGTRARRSAFVEGVLEWLPILPVDLPTARLHAEIWARLDDAGTPVGAHDLWLAASCMARSLSLATCNVRELRRVAGLEIEDWRASPGSEDASHD